MRKVLFTILVAIILFSFFGCAEFNPLEPENNIYEVPTTLGVEIELDLEKNKIRIFNSNSQNAGVGIYRLDDGEYIEVFNELIQDKSELSDEIYLSEGDKIKVAIKIGGYYRKNEDWDDEDEPIRINYYEL